MRTSESRANPFPGLRPFEFHENHLFFGREGQSEELLRKLSRNRFLAVVGTSGSGKSSLVRAGLLPLLYGGFMNRAGSSWRIALFRPGKDPIHNMAAALNSPTPFEPGYVEDRKDLAADAFAVLPAPDDLKLDADREMIQVAAIETTLRRSAVGLVDYIKRARMREGENLLVVVDQFEELFRFKEKAEGGNSQNEAAAFVKLLLEAAEDETIPVYVVLTMRSDFLGDCAQFRDLPEKINESQYLIPRMTRDQQRDAITCPAAVRGAKMTQRLLHRLLNDVGDNPDQLPILQHALMRTWDFWTKGDGADLEIDLQHYEAIGGMAEALSLHADEAYDELPDARSREIAEKMFKALTETVTDSREVRRPSELREICAVTEATEEEVNLVIEAFRQPGRSFLMPPPGVVLEPQTLIDISHESLIRNWGLLKEWVAEEAQSSRMYRRVADAAVLYREDKEGLMTDPALQFALDWHKAARPNKEWAKRYHPEFDLALEFLKKSEERRAELAAAAERRRQAEIEREKRDLENAQALAEARRRQAEYEKTLAEEQQRRAEDEKRAAEELAAARLRETEIAQKLAKEQEQLAEVEHRRAEEQARSARRLRYAVAALIVMVLATGGFAVYAITQKRVAESQKLMAESQKAIAEEQRVMAEHEKERAQEAKNIAQDSLIQRNKALEAEELAKNKALKANLEAQKQAKAAKESEVVAQRAQAKEKEQRDIAEKRATERQTALNKLNATLSDLQNANDKNERNRRGLEALEIKDLNTAEKELNALHGLSAGDEKGQAWVEYNLGAIYRMKGDYAKAGEKYKAALAKREKYGKDSLEVAAVLNKLAQVNSEQGNFDYATDEYERLLNIQEAHAPTKDVLYDLKSEIAGFYLRQAKYAEGIRRDLENNIKEFYVSNLPRLKGARQMGDVARSLDQKRRQIASMKKSGLENYAKAEEFYSEVVSFREKEHLFDDFSPNHPDLIASYNNLAALYQERAAGMGYASSLAEQKLIEADAEKAKQLYDLTRLLSTNKLRNPREGRRTEVDQIALIANAYAQLNMYPQAELMYERMLTVLQAAYISDPKSLDFVIDEFAYFFRERKKYAKVEELFMKTLPLYEKSFSTDLSFGPGLAGQYEKLGLFYWERKKYADAEQFIKKALTVREKVFQVKNSSETKWDLLNIVSKLALLYKDQNRLVEAEALYKQALAGGEQVFGRDNGVASIYAYALGHFYYQQKRYEEAEPLLKQTQRYFVQLIGPEKRGTEFDTDTLDTPVGENLVVYTSPDIYIKALLDLAAIKTERGENQAVELLYGELLSVLKWIPYGVLGSTTGLMTGKTKKNDYDMYAILHARSLESYAAFLTKTNRAAEAEKMKKEAEQIRASVGHYEEPPPWRQ